MISLKLTDIAVTKEQDTSLKSGYLYKDVALDLEQSHFRINQLNKSVPIRDIQVLYDIEAVKNSIRTCFLTSPGQKILTPLYGIDLRRYLFEPINDSTAYFIKDDIRTKLPQFEPRITLTRVQVVPNIDELQYDVYMQIDVPSLNVYGVSLRNYLNSEGYF